jgi:branched-chain amino acid transport system permease protein
LPSLRLRGDYLAIVTLGFGEIIRVVIQNIEEVGGNSGFNGLPLLTNFIWVYALAILCVLAVRNLAASNLGRSMRAVREDEVAAEAAGVNTTRVKVLAFVVSAMWAGVAGGLQAMYNQSAHPESFNFIKSVEIVVMVVLGGLGSITGAAIAAVLLTMLENVLRSVTGATLVGFALIGFAAILSFGRHRGALLRERSTLAWISWLIWPLLSALALALATIYAGDWLQNNISALRYVIYALILIVLMILRPQGLLGRGELSWAFLRNPLGRTPQLAPETVAVSATFMPDETREAPGEHEPANEGIEGELK